MVLGQGHWRYFNVAEGYDPREGPVSKALLRLKLDQTMKTEATTESAATVKGTCIGQPEAEGETMP